MKSLTIKFIVLMIVLITVYDVSALYYGGTEASISHVIIVWSYNYPVFTFAMGFLCGHLFWRVKNTKELIELLKDKKED